jgi:hypothetical protein
LAVMIVRRLLYACDKLFNDWDKIISSLAVMIVRRLIYACVKLFYDWHKIRAILAVMIVRRLIYACVKLFGRMLSCLDNFAYEQKNHKCHYIPWFLIYNYLIIL